MDNTATDLIFIKNSSNANLEELVYKRLKDVVGICRFIDRRDDKIILNKYKSNMYDFMLHGGIFQKKWIDQLLNAIRGMHSHGIIHGDINPRNILLDENLDAFIADMDSCIVDGDLRTYDISRKSGTERWMSANYSSTDIPEMRDDYYSLGYVIWFVITRRRPFDEIDLEDIEDHIIKGGQESLNDIPETYKQIILNLWNR